MLTNTVSTVIRLTCQFDHHLNFHPVNFPVQESQPQLGRELPQQPIQLETQSRNPVTSCVERHFKTPHYR